MNHRISSRHPQTTRIPRPAAFAFNTATLLLASALLASAPKAHALVNIARGTIDLQTTLAGTYESYFIGSATNDPDWYYSIAPILEFYRKAGLASINADAGITFTRFDQNTQFNSSYPSASLRIALPTQPGARLDGNFAISYVESDIVDFSLNDRIPTKAVNGSLTLNYRLGDKTSLTEVASYTKLIRDSEDYSDQQIWSNRLGFRYNEFFHRTNLALDYDFTKTDTSGHNYLDTPLNQRDNALSLTLSHPVYGEIMGSFTYGYHIFRRGAAETAAGVTRDSSSFIGVGIEGPFLPPALFPKLTSRASLYYRSSASAGLNYSGAATLTGSLSLSWAARPRTTISINADRTTTLNAADFSVINSSVGMGISETVGSATILAASVSYRWSQYQGIDRNDHFLNFNASASHTLNQYWSIALNYNFQNNQNTGSGPQILPRPGASYDRHLVTLSVTAKF